jgi:methyl-accepting chemotaxis protein
VPLCSNPTASATGIRWQWKVFIPIIAVLLLSIVAIASVLETLGIHEEQIILLASVCFAILHCFVLLSVLLVLVERPLEDLMETIARVLGGDLSARIAFAKRRDDIGQLGRQFNEMVEQLERNRGEIEKLHCREMGRAESISF